MTGRGAFLMLRSTDPLFRFSRFSRKLLNILFRHFFPNWGMRTGWDKIITFFVIAVVQFGTSPSALPYSRVQYRWYSIWRCRVFHLTFFSILITGFQIGVTDVKRCSITKNCNFFVTLSNSTSSR